jgi:hypothetical protein
LGRQQAPTARGLPLEKLRWFPKDEWKRLARSLSEQTVERPSFPSMPFGQTKSERIGAEQKPRMEIKNTRRMNFE